jgi:hypothetical protein
MHLSQVISVVLRLFAIRWLYNGITIAASHFFLFEGLIESHLLSFVGTLLFPVCLIAMAFIMWWFAPALSRFLIAGPDPIVFGGALKREDLFSAGVLVVGSWLALTNLGSAFTWTHHLMVTKQFSAAASGGESPDIYQGFQYILAFIGGLLLAIKATSIGTKLARLGPLKEEA